MITDRTTGGPNSLHERGRDSCYLRAVLCYKRLFTKACMGCKQFILKEGKNVMFLNKIDVRYCLVVFFAVCPRLRPFWSVSARYSSGVPLLRERDLAVMSLGRLWPNWTPLSPVTITNCQLVSFISQCFELRTKLISMNEWMRTVTFCNVLHVLISWISA